MQASVLDVGSFYIALFKYKCIYLQMLNTKYHQTPVTWAQIAVATVQELSFFDANFTANSIGQESP